MQEEYAYSGIGGLGTLSDQKRKVRPLGTPRDVNSVADIEGASVKVAYGEKYKNKPDQLAAKRIKLTAGHRYSWA